MLAIQKYLHEHGLAKAVETFKLKVREYPHKVLLKYDQIESDMKLEEVQDCRGLILEMNTWEVMCMSFRKFFNSAEGSAATIDWDSAIVMEKLDGSLVQLYFDTEKSEWIPATSGSGEGEGEVNNKMGTTFNQLFWQTAEKVGLKTIQLENQFTYVFELTTPYNIVVKPHGESSITLLAMRHVKTLEEMPYDILTRVAKAINVPLVKAYDLNAMSSEDLIKTLEGMPWHDEGYVVVDGNFNRIKIKNPAYVAVHHLKSKTGEHNIMTIVKTNEIDEFASTFPERREEIVRLKENYDKLVANLEDAWTELALKKCIDDSAPERKRFAMEVFAFTSANEDFKQFSGLFFGLNTGKVSTIKGYMTEYEDKILYKML